MGKPVNRKVTIQTRQFMHMTAGAKTCKDLINVSTERERKDERPKRKPRTKAKAKASSKIKSF